MQQILSTPGLGGDGGASWQQGQLPARLPRTPLHVWAAGLLAGSQLLDWVPARRKSGLRVAACKRPPPGDGPVGVSSAAERVNSAHNTNKALMRPGCRAMANACATGIDGFTYSGRQRSPGQRALGGVRHANATHARELTWGTAAGAAALPGSDAHHCCSIPGTCLFLLAGLLPAVQSATKILQPTACRPGSAQRAVSLQLPRSHACCQSSWPDPAGPGGARHVLVMTRVGTTQVRTGLGSEDSCLCLNFAHAPAPAVGTPSATAARSIQSMQCSAV